MTPPLAGFARNVYSQFGEDGILEELVSRIRGRVSSQGGGAAPWVVELGAWDGVHLSNACNLIKSHGWNAVLIEGEADRIARASIHHPTENVIKVRKFVTLSDGDTLDDVLGTTPVPEQFDVLSIDIDGCDYWVFNSLNDYRPCIVVIEFNPSIPNPVDFVQAPDFTVKHGSSAAALTRLAKEKGYALAAVTLCNLVLIREDLAEDAGVAPQPLEDLRDDAAETVYLFSGYDGTILLSRETVLPWHGCRVSDGTLKVIPKIFRRYPGDWGSLRRLLWRFYWRLSQ